MANNPGVVSSVNIKDMKDTKKSKNKEKSKKSHPSTATMVHAAISSLNDRQGSSIRSIMKFIESNYQVDMKKIKVHLKRYMKNAVAQELLVQTKGHGFTGSFKLPSKSKKPKTDIKAVNQKPSKKKMIELSVKVSKVDDVPKKLEKSPKKSTVKQVVETKAKVTKLKATGKSQKKVQVPKAETAPIKKHILSTPENSNENLKSPSKTKKVRSPVVKKTPRPKRMAGTKTTN